MQPIILPKISRILPFTPGTTYFYILVPALTPEGAILRAEWFMRRRTYGVKYIYATNAKRINLRTWEVEVVVIKSSSWESELLKPQGFESLAEKATATPLMEPLQKT